MTGPLAGGKGKAAADRPIFIVGCARSGTTLLQVMLHSHPRIAIPPETRYLMEVYNRRLEFGDLREPENVDRLVDWIIGESAVAPTKFEDLGLDAEVVRREAHKVPPTIGSVLGVVLALYAARWGKPRWGDKRPNYIRHLPQLLRLFPDAQILHIIRDGRDCVASLKEMPWWKHGTRVAMLKWIEAIEMAHWANQTLGPDQYFEFRYEDLVAAPLDHAQRICDFLGESFDERMLESHQMAADAVPERKTWHSRTHGQIDDKAVAKWKSKLSRYELRLMENVAGRYLREYGYQPSLVGRLLWPPRKALAGYRDLERKIEAKRRLYEESDQAIDEAYGWPVAADLAKIRPATEGVTSA